MSDQAGEKTEKPTGKRLEEALNKGQIARSAEVQTVFVLGGALLALGLTGAEMWRVMAESCASTFSHLHGHCRHHQRHGRVMPLRVRWCWGIAYGRY